MDRVKGLGCAGLVIAVIAWLLADDLRGLAIVAERDALSAVLPVKLFLARSLARWEIPWWNAAPALGKPFFPDPLAGVLYPWNPLLLVRPFARGFGLLLVTQYVWTALGALLLLRTSGLTRAPAMLGALLWALGGSLVSLANVVNHLCAIAWLPWVIYAWVRPSAVSSRIVFAALALTPALLAGSPEMSALAAVALLFWTADWRALAAPVLALALAGIQIVPTLAYLAWSHRGAVLFEEAEFMRFSAPPLQLAQLAWPVAGPLEPAPFLASAFLGPIPVALALVGLLGAPRRRLVACLFAAGGVMLVALGPATPVLPWLHAWAPGLSLVRYPGKAIVALHALVAFGAAAGFARLLGAAQARQGGDGVGKVATWALWAAAIVAVLQLAYEGGQVVSRQEPASVLEAPAIARAMTSASVNPPRYYSNTAGLPGGLSLEESLRVDREMLLAATGELYGLANVNTPSSLNLIPHEILQKALTSASRERALGALATLGTSYVTSWVPLPPPSSAVAVPYGGGFRARLYRLPDASPRAWIAQRVASASDALGAIGRFVLTSPGYHRGLAVLEGNRPDVLDRIAEGSSGTVTWVEENPAGLVLQVDLERPGLVVVADTWIEGWTAEVDGQAAEILRVNGLVRGVVVDGGSHRLEMRYSPPGLREGALLSLAGVLCLVLLALVARRSSRPAHGVP